MFNQTSPKPKRVIDDPRASKASSCCNKSMSEKSMNYKKKEPPTHKLTMKEDMIL